MIYNVDCPLVSVHVEENVHKEEITDLKMFHRQFRDGFLSCDVDNKIKSWQVVPDFDEQIQIKFMTQFNVHKDGVACLDVTSDGLKVLSTSFTGRVILIDHEMSMVERDFNLEDCGINSGFQALFTHDQNQFAVSNECGQIDLYDLRMDSDRVLRLTTNLNEIRSMKVDAQSAPYIGCCDSECRVSLVDPRKGKSIYAAKGMPFSTESMALSARYIATATDEGQVCMFDLSEAKAAENEPGFAADQKCTNYFFEAQPDQITSMIFTPSSTDKPDLWMLLCGRIDGFLGTASNFDPIKKDVLDDLSNKFTSSMDLQKGALTALALNSEADRVFGATDTGCVVVLKLSSDD